MHAHTYGEKGRSRRTPAVHTTTERRQMLPTLTLHFDALSIGAPKRKMVADPKRYGHHGLANDAAAPLSLVALSRIVVVRDESILQTAAQTPIGVMFLGALRAAVRRLALSPSGGATAAFGDTTTNALFNTSASTIAVQSRYSTAGLTLPVRDENGM